jgi:hypothetical protein
VGEDVLDEAEVALASVVLAALESLSCGSDHAVPRGHWGGLTIDMDVTDQGGAVVLCCFRATIDEPMVLDSSGRFDVMGQESFGQRFHYFGSVTGDTMTLRIETFVAGVDQPFPVTGPEGTDFHFVLHPGVPGTYQHPDGTGACICGNPMDPPGHFPAGGVSGPAH